MEELLETLSVEGRSLSAFLSTTQTHDDWDRFLQSSPLGQFQQAGAWAACKAGDGWETIRVVIRDGATVCAGFQLIVRRTRFGRIGYLNKGPVIPLASGQSALAAFVVKQFRESARRSGLLVVIVQAPDAGPQIADLMSRNGLLDLGLSFIIEATQTVCVAAPAAGDWREGVRKTTQRHVRRALKGGVTIREGNAGDLPLFFELMRETCRRQGVAPNPASLKALQDLWTAFAAVGKARMTFAMHGGEELAALLCFRFGNRVTFWKKGWNSKGLKLYPNELIFYEALEWTERVGCELADFVGMDPDIARANIENRPVTSAQIATRYWFLTGFGGTSQILPHAQLYFPNAFFRFLYARARPILVWLERWKKNRAHRSTRQAPTPSTSDSVEGRDEVPPEPKERTGRGPASVDSE